MRVPYKLLLALSLLSITSEATPQSHSFQIDTYPTSPVDKDTLLALLQQKEKYYAPGFEPPQLNCYVLKDEEKFKQLRLDQATVYVLRDPDQEVTGEEVRRFIDQREPTNIAMKTHCKSGVVFKDSKEVTYKQAYYRTYYEQEKRLPPNIGIYGSAWAQIKKDGKLLLLRVPHNIGIPGWAFDDSLQPDAQHFTDQFSVFGESKLKEGKKEELIARYAALFTIIFRCAADKEGIEYIAMNLVGANNFASGYPGGKERFQAEIFCPAWKLALSNEYTKLEESGVQGIYFMGSNKKTAHTKIELATVAQLNEITKQYGLSTREDRLGLVPTIYKNIQNRLFHELTLGNILFTDAPDNFTFLGNGNERDCSLEGYRGRSMSLMALMMQTILGLAQEPSKSEAITFAVKKKKRKSGASSSKGAKKGRGKKRKKSSISSLAHHPLPLDWKKGLMISVGILIVVGVLIKVGRSIDRGLEEGEHEEKDEESSFLEE